MADDVRVFARWRREPSTEHGYAQVPADGACLSAFLLVTDPRTPGQVLLGEPDPGADWPRIGAMGRERIERAAGKWMLPASHLIQYESPQDAAARIAAEQLGLPGLRTAGPVVVSDVYGREGSPDRHWDLDFLFRAEWPAGRPLRATPWKSLEFHDPRQIPRERFTRSHDDILRFAGFVTGP